MDGKKPRAKRTPKVVKEFAEHVREKGGIDVSVYARSFAEGRPTKVKMTKEDHSRERTPTKEDHSRERTLTKEEKPVERVETEKKTRWTDRVRAHYEDVKKTNPDYKWIDASRAMKGK
jgi:hypothetical protein